MLLYYVQKALIDNYANFSGRASRAEYWYNVLFGFIIGLVFPIIGAIISASIEDAMPIRMVLFGMIIFSLVFLIPSIALVVRRLHDIGKSGWWYFIILIPCGIGFIWFLVLMLQEGDFRENLYGEKPED